MLSRALNLLPYPQDAGNPRCVYYQPSTLSTVGKWSSDGVQSFLNDDYTVTCLSGIYNLIQRLDLWHHSFSKCKNLSGTMDIVLRNNTLPHRPSDVLRCPDDLAAWYPSFRRPSRYNPHYNNLHLPLCVTYRTNSDYIRPGAAAVTEEAWHD